MKLLRLSPHLLLQGLVFVLPLAEESENTLLAATPLLCLLLLQLASALLKEFLSSR